MCWRCLRGKRYVRMPSIKKGWRKKAKTAGMTLGVCGQEPINNLAAARESWPAPYRTISIFNSNFWLFAELY